MGGGVKRVCVGVAAAYGVRGEGNSLEGGENKWILKLKWNFKVFLNNFNQHNTASILYFRLYDTLNSYRQIVTLYIQDFKVQDQDRDQDNFLQVSKRLKTET